MYLDSYIVYYKTGLSLTLYSKNKTDLIMSDILSE